MSTAVICDCGKRLHVQESQVGKRIRCPGCRAVLAVPASKARQPAPARRPSAPRSRRRPAPGLPWPWLMGAGAVALLLLAVASLVAWRIHSRSSHSPDAASVVASNVPLAPPEGRREGPPSPVNPPPAPTPPPPPEPKPHPPVPVRPVVHEEAPRPSPVPAAPPARPEPAPAPAPPPRVDPPAPPAPPAPPPAPKPPANPRPPARPANPRTQLAQKVKFPGLDDPRTTLEESLDFLSFRYNLAIEIDARAFANQAIPEVKKTEIVGQAPLPAENSISLGVLLQTILNRVSRDVPATFVILRDRVRVVPLDGAVMQAIAREAAASPLRRRLGKRIALGNGFQGKTTVKDLAEFLAAKHDLVVIAQPGLTDQPVQLPRAANVSIELLLREVGRQIEGSLFLLRDDHIFLVGRQDPAAGE